jgi:dinuclear metal center YbgI/SA1388 family protein
MITLIDLEHYLKELLLKTPVSDYCPNGIQIEGQPQIKRIATAVSASLETIQAAITWEADVLIVHHGLFWQGDSYVISGVKREKMRLLIENNLSLLAYHLPLDMHQEVGNNWKAAQELGWIDLQPFGPYKGIPIGVKGNVAAIPREEFQKQLEDYYQHAAHWIFGGKSVIQTAALISGGAYKNITDAIAEGVDCFITGNFDEPVWHQAIEGKINFFALGHSATERIGPRALGEHLAKLFPIEHTFIDIPNPF